MTTRILSADLLLAGPEGEAIADGAVLVRDDLIADLGPRADVLARAEPGTPHHRFPGATILPGLIDTHVHLSLDPTAAQASAIGKAGDGELLLAMAGHARRLLDIGVTTVRDLGGRGNLAGCLRDAVAAGDLPGPRILTAGVPITVTGGHFWFLGGEADGVPEIRAAVRRNLRAGVDVIKLLVNGSRLTPGGPRGWHRQLTDEEIAAAVEEARRFGRPVAAHVLGADAIEASIEAGVRTLEHCSFGTPAGPVIEPAARDALIATIAASGAFVCPTWSITMSETAARIGDARMRPWLEVARHQYENGVRLIAGTDAGTPGVPFELYVDGLEWFVRAGIPTTAALESATVIAAEALGLAERTGRLAPGLDADLIVVTGDPREDLAVLRAIRLVLARGRVHTPADGGLGAALGSPAVEGEPDARRAPVPVGAEGIPR
ncbi:amidohydrolase family protein [Embleya sp. NPDC127516]|uniref:metal-dependent hydrolase family protein n=1 Tax=Embleya sp. NPDC127516 TaxID=3363990 RepID=UPI00381B61D7